MAVLSSWSLTCLFYYDNERDSSLLTSSAGSRRSSSRAASAAARVLPRVFAVRRGRRVGWRPDAGRHCFLEGRAASLKPHEIEQ